MKDMTGETWIEMLPNPWMYSIACIQRIQASLCAYIRLHFELLFANRLLYRIDRTIFLDRYGSDDLSSAVLGLLRRIYYKRRRRMIVTCMPP